MDRPIHELLAPAGNYEKALFALNFGADAIYIGPKSYSLRARASNFDIEEINNIVKYAHSLNKKVYVVLNIICHNIHLKNFPDYFKRISDCNVDGIICADPFIIKKIREIDKDMDIHISTQQSVTNSKACEFWKRNGASRVVLAREVDYNNLKLITEKVKDKIEIEYFIHGAVCISYSGRCTMSNNFSFRNANIGGCAHSCRWGYDIINCPEIKYKFTMSAKDMNLSTQIDKLLKLNIHSFKVEGRMKSLHYIATIISSYKKLINNFYKYEIIDENLLLEIKKAENRKADIACFDGYPTFNKMLYFEEEKKAIQNFVFIVQEILEDNKYKIIVKNFFKVGDLLESISYKGQDFKFKVLEMTNEGLLVDLANKPMHEYIIKLDSSIKLNSMDVARRSNEQ